MNYIPNTPEGTRDRLFGECMERRSVQKDLTRLIPPAGIYGDYAPRRWSITMCSLWRATTFPRKT